VTGDRQNRFRILLGRPTNSSCQSFVGHSGATRHADSAETLRPSRLPPRSDRQREPPRRPDTAVPRSTFPPVPIPSPFAQAKPSRQGLPGQGRSDIGCSTLPRHALSAPRCVDEGRRDGGWERYLRETTAAALRSRPSWWSHCGNTVGPPVATAYLLRGKLPVDFLD
jgi:hypothetical protein